MHSPAERRAVIDIGTNSVKVLVADVQGWAVTPVFERGEQTRLGRGFYETLHLQPEAIQRTANVVAAFAAAARHAGATRLRTIATSAAREARNASELLQAVHAAADLDVEIISGEQEADWAFQGVNTDPSLHDAPLLILDVGGGSTEFILGRGQKQLACHSFPLGTVRLLEELQPADPPTPSDWSRCHTWLLDFLQREIEPILGPDSPRQSGESIRLVGTGGTAAILARIALEMASFDRAVIEAARLSIESLKHRRQILWNLPLAARRTIVGLPPERADVILTGIAIWEAVMEFLVLPELRVSTRGLRFAAILFG